LRASSWQACLLATMLVFGARRALGAGTYCVGGFEGMPPNHVPACDLPAASSLHRGCWHDHVFVTDGAHCFDCWDECDATCVSGFLEDHPNFRPVDPYECARRSIKDQPGGVLFHVIDGAAIKPLAPASKLAAVLSGAVRDETGRVRPIGEGHFHLAFSDGTARDIKGSLASDGTLQALFALPDSGSVDIQFVPTPPRLQGDETMLTKVSAAIGVRIDRCDLRAEVVSPGEDEPIVASLDSSLRVQLRRGSQVITTPADALLIFHVRHGTQDTELHGTRGSSEGTWKPPPSPSIQPVTITAKGTAGGETICPLGPRKAWLSDAGLGVDLSKLPTHCYTGPPCSGAITLRRPAGGPGRAAVDALLADPATSGFTVDNGVETRVPSLPADDRYAFAPTYSAIGGAAWSLAFQTAKGRVQLPAHQLQVRPALRLSLPPVLDFGEVEAGTATLDTCRRLDFSGSQAAEEHRWVLEGENLGSCASSPVLAYRDASGAAALLPLSGRITIDALDPLQRWLLLCLKVPPCAADTSPPNASIRVSPVTPEFASQAATVSLRWSVHSKSLLACQGWWLLPLLALFGVTFIACGFISPARFPSSCSIRLSGSELGLRRASAVPLRECPGAGPGFYRDARLGIDGSGNIAGQTRHALVLLRPTRGDSVTLTGSGPLERKERRTGKLVPVADLAKGHEPESGDVYRAGEVWFSLELT
jgi:hypothetical protein